jgi:hypothetical protein
MHQRLDSYEGVSAKPGSSTFRAKKRVEKIYGYEDEEGVNTCLAVAPHGDI